jgi:NADH-quinone oxidoreductase subunit M
LAVLSSWAGVDENVGFFHFNLMATLAGVTGVFVARDLILFYLFWELMLVPLYLLIRIWGGERRLYAATKFFLFTQAGGLLLLLGILGLAFAHHAATGQFTFDYLQLIGTSLSDREAFWLMLAFFIGFAMKLPAWPLHPWLPEAHSQAPTAGSVLLAGLVLKAGGYGLLRFIMPLFPQAGPDFATVAMALAAAGILYGAALAFAQNDLKRLIACSSISHMGFVLMGVFAFNELALQGAVIVMIAHGLTTGTLFALAGELHRRFHTHDMGSLGGLWATIPRMGGAALFFVLAGLGLPGLAGFVGEFLVMLGAYQVSPVLAVGAAGGLVLSVVYSLRIIQQVFHGPASRQEKPADLSAREWGMVVAMIAATLWVGLFPQRFLDTSGPAVRHIQQTSADNKAKECRP